LTAQGHPRAIFRRAIERGNLLIAETTAREIGRVSLVEALELAALIALKDARRRGRACTRWLQRYLEARPHASIEEAALAASALGALGGRCTTGRCPPLWTWPKGRLAHAA
jgi:hypothetical protein